MTTPRGPGRRQNRKELLTAAADNDNSGCHLDGVSEETGGMKGRKKWFEVGWMGRRKGEVQE
jgi:hypothetical protein